MAVTRGMRYLRELGVPFAEHRHEHRVKGAAYAAGYQIGGISPFGSKTALPVYAVAGWLARERVALNGGARGVIIELAGADLARILSPTPIPE